MKISAVIPTYNEADNLSALISTLFGLPLELTILIVDDNSPDGTGNLAEKLATKHPGRIFVLHRPFKLGISSAYVQGFRHLLQEHVDAVAQIDADLSHDPVSLVEMAKHLETCDVVFGSRYTQGGSVDMQWPLWRKRLSAWGNFYARIILRLPVRDITTGYRLWRSETLWGIPFTSVQSKGYIFQVEMAYLAHYLGYRIGEIPIHFADRCYGKSKMSFQIQVEAAWRVWQILLTHRHLSHYGRAARTCSEFQSNPLR